jgi:hypothetical protein
MPGEVRVPTWDNVTAESAAFFRSNIPGLRPVSGTLETDDHAISLIETVSDLSVGVGRIVQGDPEDGRRMGIYGVAELRLALDLVERLGAEAVHLVEGPRELGGHPRLVLLCEDPDGTISRQCALVAPREDVQQGVV